MKSKIKQILNTITPQDLEEGCSRQVEELDKLFEEGDCNEIYICSKCKEEWIFFPEDYENKEDCPTICPLCEMPISQMIIDVYREEGLWQVIRRLWIRIISPK